MAALLCFLLILLSAFPAYAQNTGHRLKLVFPFGENTQKTNQNTCPTEYDTLDGCCDDDPAEVYTWSGMKGCCKSPKQLTDGKCCPFCDGTWVSGTESTCGSCCPQWYQTPGLCCTKGVDWITENINGIDSSRCCPANLPNATSSVFTFKGKNFPIENCCRDGASLYAVPYFTSYVAGTTSVNYVNWATGCCPSPYQPASTALGAHLCCEGRSAYAHYGYVENYLLNGSRFQEYTVTSCCTEHSPNLIDLDGTQTICCPAGVGGYLYSTARYWSILHWLSYTAGCCTPNQPQTTPFTDGTTCCAAGETVTEFIDYSYRGSIWGDNTLRTGHSPSCCPAANVRQTPANGTLCCPTGVDHYTFMSAKGIFDIGKNYQGGCCTTASPKAVPVGTIGTYCCPEGVGAATNLNFIDYYLSDVNNLQQEWTPKCCTTSSPVAMTLFNPKDNNDLGQLCCPAGVSPYTFTHTYGSYRTMIAPARRISYSFGCCDVGETPQILPDTRGTYCCPNNSSAYTHQHSWKIYDVLVDQGVPDKNDTYFYRVGCCTAQSPYLVQASANQTICCPTSHAAFLTVNETFLPDETAYDCSYAISCCNNGETAKSIMNGTQCCPTEFSAFGFRHSLSYFDTDTLAEYKMSTGCCTAASPALVSIPGGWGTYCCPAGKTVTTSIAYANNSRLRWVYPACQ